MAAYTNDGNDSQAMLSDKSICMRAVQGQQTYFYCSFIQWLPTVMMVMAGRLCSLIRQTV